MNIISNTEITVEQAKVWAKSKKATDLFIRHADLYWKLSEHHGNINPALAYVQYARETGYGKFGGVIDISYCNPCGLKNNKGGDCYDKNAHHKFIDWEEGIKAHLDHLALYAGAKDYPKYSDDIQYSSKKQELESKDNGVTPDPRHFYYLYNKCKTVEDLTGTWAMDEAYANGLIKSYNELMSTPIPPKTDILDKDIIISKDSIIKKLYELIEEIKLL